MGERKLTLQELRRVLIEASKRMQERHVKEVRDLDAEIGDGDLGITVQKGFGAVQAYLEAEGADDTDISTMLKQAGLEFNEANPSTFGAFFATAFRKASVVVRGKEDIAGEDLCAMFEASVGSIVKLGKAKAGDKTLLDALIPASEAVCAGAGRDETIKALLDAAAESARTGMESTVGMISRQGRARSFGERTRDVRDPGATVVYLFLHEIADTFE
jgi:dihydroxyacetone kinase-like protein